jgi:hypothetical protein
MHAGTQDVGEKTLPSSQTTNIHTLINMEGVNKRFMVPEQEIFQVEDRSSKFLRNVDTCLQNYNALHNISSILKMEAECFTKIFVPVNLYSMISHYFYHEDGRN